MKKKTITFNVLEEQDVENILSEKLGRPVKLSEMDVTLVDAVPLAASEGDLEDITMFCEVTVDGKEVLNEDYMSPLDEYMPAQPYTDEKYIFAFSTKKFKSYSRYTDTSD